MKTKQRIQLVREGDNGYTLVEALVVMLIFGVVFAIIVGVLIQVSYSAADNMTRVSQVQNAELGLMQIDRQVRSGNVILDPANEQQSYADVEPGYSLRVFTQTDGVHQCVQWRVAFDENDRGTLEFRSWDPDWSTGGGEVTDWAVVARDLVPEQEDGVPFKSTHITGEETAATSSVDVSIYVQGENTRTAPTSIATTLTGRNTIYGYPIDRCNDVPAP